MYRHYFSLFLIVLTLLTSGCQHTTPVTANPQPAAGGVSPMNPQHHPTRVCVFLDLSDSVSDEQRAAWLIEIRKVLARLGPGDQILIFGVHEATLQAAALFVDEIPRIDPSRGIDATVQLRAAVRKARDEATAQFQEALTGKGGALQTNLLAAIDRIQADTQQRQTQLYFFSDMIHVSEELNMERTRLEKNPQRSIQRILDRHGWAADRLKGASVYCVLPGARGQAKLNDRMTLQSFWGALLGALGAELKSFETYLHS